MKAVSEYTISAINDGAQGPQGVSVISEQKQYRLSNSSTELTGSGEGYTWSTTMPQVSANTYLWIRTATNLSDNSTIYSNATCDVTISGVVSTVDSVQQSITNKVWSSDISSSINAYDTNNGTETSIRDRVSQTETDISGITSRVSDVETTTTSLGTHMTAAESSIRQNANNISSKVSKDSIISEINQSAESVTIQASKVDLIGNVTFSMLDTAAQNRITTAESTASTASQNASAAVSTANTANTNASSALSAVNGSIKSTTMHYLATTASSGVTRSTSGWTTTIQSITSTNRYLWTYQTITKVDDSTSYTDPVISGVWGNTGTSVTVSSSETTYQAGTSGTTAPTGTWQSSVPTVTDGQYLWTRVVTTFSDSSTATSYSVAKQGAQGTSVSVSSTSTTYQSGTSGTTAPTGTWQTSVPSVAQGNYLWTKTVVTYSDGNSTTSYSVSYQSEDGDKGDKGIGVSKVEVLYRSANSTTAPAAPTSLVTSTSTNANTWTLATPTYNASYPYYYTCTQTQYTEGNPTWTTPARSKAIEDALTTANTANTNASSAVTTANTANTNASTALSTANTANTNASTALTTANTANTNATHAKDIIDNWATDATSTTTTIKGGLIQTHTILSDALSTDSIMSSNYVGPEVTVSSGAFVTYEDGVDEMPVKSCVLNIEPVQSGTGDPSPDNVRPISGWTKATVTRTGKNLYDANAINTRSSNGITATVNNGMITLSGTATGNAFFSVVRTGLVSGRYVFSLNNPIASSGVHVSFRKTSGGYFSDTAISEVNKSVTISGEPSSVILYVKSGTTLTNFVVKPQLESGATATDYEPYQGDVYSITFPSEAGTVYGGTLDVGTGVLTVDRAMVDLGTLNWSRQNISGHERIQNTELTGIIKGTASNATKANILCSIYATITTNGTYNHDEGIGIAVSQTSVIFVYDNNYTDAATFKAAMSGVQLVYELANPIEITLMPTQIDTLFGTNNIWADVGDITVGFQNAYGDDIYSQNGTYLDLYSGSLTTPHFVVDNVTGNAYFKGEVVADSGSIGGWVIGQNELYSVYDDGMFTNYKVFLKNYEGAGSDWSTTKVIGINSGVSYPFYVTGTGKLYAQNAEINGIINSISGSIGGWEISEKELSSSVEIDDVEYSLFMRKFDDGTILATMNGGTSIDVNYIGDGVFELTPQTNGSGTITFSYNLSDYPTKKFHVWSSYHDDRDLQVLPTLMNNGEYWSIVADAVVVNHITGEQTIDITSFNFTGGTLYVSLRFTDLNTSDGTYTLKFEISDYDDVQYKIVSSETINDAALDVGVIGIKKKENSEITYPFYVNRRGEIYAERAFLNGGEIAGFTIVKNDTAGTTETTANDGHVYQTGLYVHSSDGTYEYETGIRGSSTDDEDEAFYVRKIAQDGTWDSSTPTFYVKNNGYLYANNADITGTITATSGSFNGNITAQGGTIGGFNIKKGDGGCADKTSANGGHAYPNSLYVHNADDTYEYETGIKGETSSSNPNTLAFYVTRITKGGNWQTTSNGGTRTDIFKIGHGGTLYCSNADITGKITATSGSFKGDVTASTLTAKNTLYLHNSSGTKKVAITAPDSSFGSSLSIGTGFSALYLAKQTVIGGSLMVYEDGTGPLTCGSITCDKVNIDSVSVTINNTTAKRQGRFTCSDAKNVGLWDVTNNNWIIVSNSDLEVRVPHVFYSYGLLDTTQRSPVGSSNVANQGVSWLGGTATSTLSIRAQWNASSPATKTVAVASSDIRLKKDIVDSQVDALEVINRVKLREFTWKDNGVRQKIGVVVDELEELDPLLSVGGGEDENGEPIYKSVNNLLMISYLTKAVQQLSAQVDSLQNEIKELKGDK